MHSCLPLVRADLAIYGQVCGVFSGNNFHVLTKVDFSCCADSRPGHAFMIIFVILHNCSVYFEPHLCLV